MRCIIKNARNSTYSFRHELHERGFEFCKSKKEWSKDIANNERQLIINQFAHNGLKIIFADKNNLRGTNYRKDFVDHSQLVIHKNGKRLYRCVYCHKLLTDASLTVDHLIPVQAVYSSDYSDFNRKILNKFGIVDINDIKNLVPSCEKCNKSKGKKIGLWTIRGLLGKHRIFWVTYYLLSIFVFAFMLLLILQKGGVLTHDILCD